MSPVGAGVITPPGGWHNAGAVVSVSAAPNAGYQFAGFSGDLSGTVSPQNLAMNGNKTVTASFAPSAPTSDFTLDLPGSVQVEVGFQNSFRLHINPQAGFNSPINWTLTHGAPNVIAISTLHSQLGLTTATGTLYALPAASPGNYPLTVTATGGGKSHSASITLQVTGAGRAQSETNMAFVDILEYDDSHLVNDSLPVLKQLCGNGTGLRSCYQQIMNSYRSQQISGVRVMFSLADTTWYTPRVRSSRPGLRTSEPCCRISTIVISIVRFGRIHAARKVATEDSTHTFQVEVPYETQLALRFHSARYQLRDAQSRAIGLYGGDTPFQVRRGSTAPTFTFLVSGAISQPAWPPVGVHPPGTTRVRERNTANRMGGDASDASR